jgi:type IV secretion system protein TrbJ
MRINNITIKAILALTLVIATFLKPVSVYAGIPVIDAANLGENVMTAVESVAQTTKQVQQYSTQLQQYSNELQQYQNMVQNTAAPASYVWSKAQNTMNGLMNAVNTLNYYKNQTGSLNAYLNKFQDASYYSSSPCFTSSGCSAAQRAAIQQNGVLASQSQKKANDAMFKGLDLQQNALNNDAATLEQLQSGAQSATGRMQAIQYANQLASHQANQLLQIRGLLIAQQNAIATKMQADADREALQAAGDAQARSGTYSTSPARTW